MVAAARNAEAEQRRQPIPQRLEQVPDEAKQREHFLTHVPYAAWCEHCVMHRARQDRHIRDGSVKDGGIPTVSFDFAYTKAVDPARPGQEVEAVAALVMIDSSTNYISCVPIRAKNQFDLMVREILQFTQYLGHAECNYLCDNEPSIRQVQQRAVRARQGMGLATHCKTPAAYTHGNSLCENAIGRVRTLACTLMNRVQSKISTKLDTNNGLWSWAMRHAGWLLNRFSVQHGCAPYETVYSNVYKGKLTEFGEPVFSYVHAAHKGNPKWQRVLSLGKTEAQDTFVVFTGSTIMLSRSVRRIDADWKNYMGFYVHFNAPTWNFKTGFGGRVIPTRRSIQAQPASNAAPVGPILPHALHDADGEAVRNQAKAEEAEEREAAAMGGEDRNLNAADAAEVEVPASSGEQPLQNSAQVGHKQTVRCWTQWAMRLVFQRRLQ